MDMADTIAKRVCSIYDPFCPEAAGARYPSQFSQNTIVYQSRFLQSMTTSAAGDSLYLFAPDVNQYVFAYVNTAAPATFPSTFSASDPNLSSWMGLVKGVRIVSAGIRYMPQQATNIPSSIFTIGTIPDGSVLLGSSITYTSVMSQLTDLEVIGTQDPFVWSLNPRTENAFDLVSKSNIANNTRSGNWPTFVVAVAGQQANTLVGTFEVIVNYEGEPLGTQGLGYITQTAPELAQASPLVREVAEQVRSKVTGFFAGNAQSFGNFVHKTAMRSAASFVGGLLGGPAGAGAALMLTNGIQNVD